MVDTKVSALTELIVAAAADDEAYIRDISEAAADESKRITIATIQKLVANLDLNGFNIAFPATQVADAGANVLDDYEEGTFTPTLQDNSASDAESQTYDTQIGRYTKIGNRVFFTLYIDTNSIGSLDTGQQARIAGLPFTSNSTTNNFQAVYADRGVSLALPNASESVSGMIGANVTYITLRLWDATTGQTDMSIAEFSTGGQINLAGHYEI